jgi:hypothetical protein
MQKKHLEGQKKNIPSGGRTHCLTNLKESILKAEPFFSLPESEPAPP